MKNLRFPRIKLAQLRTPRFTSVVLAIFFLAALLSSAPYTMLAPSKAQPVFPRMLTYQNGSLTHKTDGNFYLLSITLTEPGAYIPGAAFLGGWLKGDVTVIPKTVLFPKNTDSKKVAAENKKDMKVSQNIAAAVALAYVQKKFPENFLTVKPQYKDVRYQVHHIGGPSAGLVFSLSLVDLLTREDLLKGRKIAATGTISKGGFVGIIGGLDEKLISVARAGATIALVPSDNCRDITRVPKGVQVIPVSTLDEAVSVLLGEKEARACTNLSA